MLNEVFTELYNKGIMLFLDIDSYCLNTTDVGILKNREEFLLHFTQPIEKGYVFTLNTDLNKLYKEIDEDSCAAISYGFESDTDDKAHDVGRNFVEVLSKYGFFIEWTEKIKNSKIITIVISEKDIPLDSQIQMYAEQFLESPELKPKEEIKKTIYTCSCCLKSYKNKKSFFKHELLCKQQ